MFNNSYSEFRKIHGGTDYEHTEFGEGGAVKAVIRRDTTAAKPWQRKRLAPGKEADTDATAAKKVANAAAVIKHVASGLARTPAPPSKRKANRELPPSAKSRRDAVARQVMRNRQATDDALVASHIGRLELKPAAHPLTANERLQIVLEKGRAKLLEG